MTPVATAAPVSNNSSNACMAYVARSMSVIPSAALLTARACTPSLSSTLVTIQLTSLACAGAPLFLQMLRKPVNKWLHLAGTAVK
jgi:hypothetical protein